MFVKKDGEKDSFITQLKEIYNCTNEINNKNLKGVPQEEFKEKITIYGERIES